MKEEIIYANCSICGNKSGYDKESLAGSTHNINGIDIVLCCPCEDNLFLKLLTDRMPKKDMENNIHTLMSDEKEAIMDLYHNTYDEDDEINQPIDEDK